MRTLTKTLFLALALAAAPAAHAVTPGTTTRNDLAGDGSTKTFSFTFKTPDASSVKCYVATVLTGCSVAPNGNQDASPGGTVTFASAPAIGAVVRVQREVAKTQALALSPYSPVPAKSIEAALDRHTMQTQEVDRDRTDLAAKEANDFANTATASGLASETSNRIAADNALTAAVAALNQGSHALADSSSVLAFGSTNPRTLTMRFAEVHNVLDETTVTPNSSSFDNVGGLEKVIWDTYNAGGGVVDLPCGTYYVKPVCAPIHGTCSNGTDRTFLRIRDNTTVRGRGRCTVIKVQDDAGDYYALMGNVNSVSNVTIENLTIDQNAHGNRTANVYRPSNPTDTLQYGISFCDGGATKCRNITIRNVWVVNATGGNPIMIAKGAQDSRVEDCKVEFHRGRSITEDTYYGISGQTEPTWSTTGGAYVNDGQVLWQEAGAPAGGETTWAHNTLYRYRYVSPGGAVGTPDYVLPSVGNGHRYKVVDFGLTAAEEPDWSLATSSGYVIADHYVAWKEAGAPQGGEATWSARALFRPGQYVVPTVANGHRYQMEGRQNPYDASAIFAHGRRVHMNRNTVYAPIWANLIGGLEVPTADAEVVGNVIDGPLVGINVTGGPDFTISPPDPATQTPLIITGNAISRTAVGVDLYTLAGATMQSVNVSGNSMNLSASLHQTQFARMVGTYTTVAGLYDTGTYQSIHIAGNVGTFDSADATYQMYNLLAAACFWIYPYGTSQTLNDFEIVGNTCVGAPGSGIAVGNSTRDDAVQAGIVRRLVAKANKFTDFGRTTSYSNGSTQWRSCFTLQGRVFDSTIEDNVCELSVAPAGGPFFWVNAFTTGTTASDFTGTTVGRNTYKAPAGVTPTVNDAAVSAAFGLWPGGPTWARGTGAPAMDAPLGSMYSRTDCSTNTTCLYVKTAAGAGAGNWTSK